MPRTMTVSKTLYKYHELDERAKERARSWWLAGELDYDWWEGVYEDAKRMLGMVGFSIDSIHFDQYKNVKIYGRWYASNVKAHELKEEAPADEDLHALADFAATIVNDSRLDADDEVEEPPSAIIGGRGRISVTESFDCNHEIDSMIQSLVKDAQSWLGRQLTREEEYLTSEEHVAESIIDNDYEFTEDGDRA